MEAHSGSRRVLMLARHFPPIGGAGVHRSVGYAGHLPEHGYQPVVITGPGGGVDRWSPPDPTLLARIPAELEVHRLAGPEPAGHEGWRARRDRWLGRPAPWVRWWVEGAVRAGLEAGADADLILASCVPYETATAGARLAEALGKPWVADLEDPWALDEMRVQPTAVHHRLDLARMRRALRTASAVIMCAPEAATRVREVLSGKIVAGIPIGFEPEDFAEAGSRSRPAAENVFRVVHTGSLHTELGLAHRRSRLFRRALGGTSIDVDILTRSAVFLIEAIERLTAAEPRLAGGIELHLAGALTAGDRAAAERHPFVRSHGQLSHEETIELMRSADLLFLPMHDLPPGRRAGLIPYKTYEYLAARRPILAAVPDGDVRDLLAPLDHVSLCRPSDVAAMSEALHAFITRGGTSPVAVDLDSPSLAELQRAGLTGRAAEVFDQVLGVSSKPRRVSAA